jgi:hypothetical protein
VVLNPKAKFKNQVEISNYCEINPNSTLKGVSKFWPIFVWNLFFLENRYKEGLVCPISSKSEVARFSQGNSIKFQPIEASMIFNLKFLSNLRKFPSEKFFLVSNTFHHILFQIFGERKDPV